MFSTPSSRVSFGVAPGQFFAGPVSRMLSNRYALHNVATPMLPARVFLSLGSNLGDRAANLRTAIAALPAAGIRVEKVSAFYETEPRDYLDQPWFLNCAIEGETAVEPVAFLRSLRALEAQLGSEKAFAKGPRLLDIDILLYGEQTIATPELQVPHPRMLERKFVLVPLAEIAPQVTHPGWSGLTVKDWLGRTADHSDVQLFRGGQRK